MTSETKRMSYDLKIEEQIKIQISHEIQNAWLLNTVRYTLSLSFSPKKKRFASAKKNGTSTVCEKGS